MRLSLRFLPRDRRASRSALAVGLGAKSDECAAAACRPMISLGGAHPSSRRGDRPWVPCAALRGE
eukprot:7024831-Prymnesium_polylepis.1